MPRILVAECKQEISSFHPVLSGYENFHIEKGDELFRQRGLNTEFGGAFPVLEGAGMELVPTVSARSGSAGLLSSEGWKKLSAEVLAEIKAKIDGIDAQKLTARPGIAVCAAVFACHCSRLALHGFLMPVKAALLKRDCKLTAEKVCAEFAAFFSRSCPFERACTACMPAIPNCDRLMSDSACQIITKSLNAARCR